MADKFVPHPKQLEAMKKKLRIILPKGEVDHDTKERDKRNIK
jgi:hypothetical protein